MKTKHLLFIAWLQFVCFNSFTQVVIKYQRTIGGDNYDYLRSMSLTREGGLIVCGNSYSGASGEKTDDLPGGWIVKLNTRGNIQWNTTLPSNGPYTLDIASIEQTNDKGYIMCGYVEEYNDYPELYVSKLDSLGKLQWEKGYGQLTYYNGIKIHQITNGNYILMVKGYGAGGFIILLDSLGNELNSTTNIPKHTGRSNFNITCAAKTSDNGLIVGGYSSISRIHSSYDYWITKIDKKGVIIWQKIYGGIDDDKCTAIEQLDDGSYVAGGYSTSNATGNKSENNKGGYDYWIIQLDGSGNMIKDKTIGGESNDYLYALQKTNDGGFIAAGTSSSDISGDKTEQSKGGSDYWVVKMKDMQIQWQKTIGGDTTDELNSIKETGANDFILGGSSLSGISGDKTDSCRGNFDYWLVEINTKNAKNITAKEVNEKIKSSSFIAKDFYVYPNPAKDMLHVITNSPNEFSLINANGKILLTKHIGNAADINVSDFAAGFYYLKNNNTNTVQKISIIK